MKQNSNGYQKPRQTKITQGETVIFPVTYELKIVMTNSSDDITNIERLSDELTKNKVVFKFQSKKESSKGNYTSYTFRVTLVSKEQMDKLYENLKNVDGLKFAV